MWPQGSVIAVREVPSDRCNQCLPRFLLYLVHVLITVCSSRGSRFYRLDSPPPFLPTVDLREIQTQCERHYGSRRVSECASQFAPPERNQFE